MEILCEVGGAAIEAIIGIFLEAVSNEAENIGRDLNVIRKGNARPAWRIEKHVC
ncbi:MAG TPA: hypothetical protein VN776_08110 [Terracidiphilus sp.]|nr:hypothetical protein [Terracidiphilus sp.]